MHFKTLARTTVRGELQNERFSEKKELNEELKLEKKKAIKHSRMREQGII